MSDYKFSMADVIKAMQEVVDEQGEDYEYESIGGACYYGDRDGNPSCIVGHVIHKLDPEAFDHVVKIEREWDSCAAKGLTRVADGAGLSESNRYLPEDFWDANTAFVLQAAQGAQDLGSPWGSVLVQAEQRARDYGWKQERG